MRNWRSGRDTPPIFVIRDEIAANRLVPVLEEFNPGDIDELHAVYLGQGGLLPLRILSSSTFWPSKSKSARLLRAHPAGDERPRSKTWCAGA
jgi:hypothetical protein